MFTNRRLGYFKVGHFVDEETGVKMASISEQRLADLLNDSKDLSEANRHLNRLAEVFGWTTLDD